jgi:hypothetical protein
LIVMILGSGTSMLLWCLFARRPLSIDWLTSRLRRRRRLP